MSIAEPLENELSLGLYGALLAKSYYGALAKKLEKLSLERHFSILILIHREKGKCCQQYLADFMNIDKVYMVKIIDTLSRDGYILRKQNPEDRREYFIELTAKGKKTVPVILKAVKEINKAALANFSKKEVHSFYEVMNSALRNLKTLPANKVTLNYKKSK